MRAFITGSEAAVPRRQPAGATRTGPRNVARLWGRASYMGLPIVLGGMLAGFAAHTLWHTAAYLFETYLAVGVLLMLCLTPAIQSICRRQVDLFDLGVGYSLVYFLYFGARALWILYDPHTLIGETPFPSVIVAGLPQAVWYADLGIAAYLLGYRLPLRVHLRLPRGPDLRSSVDAQWLSVIILVLYVLGSLARVPDLAHGWFMGFAAAQFYRNVRGRIQSLTYFLVLGLMAYALVFVRLFLPGRRGLVPWLLVGVIVPFEGLFAFVTGSKFSLITLLCIPVIIGHYLRRRISPIAMVALVGIIVFAVTPSVSTYRNTVDYRQLTIRTMGSALPHVVAEVGKSLVGLSPSAYLQASAGAFLHRLSGVDGLAVAVRGIRLTQAFVCGRTLAWIAKTLVPTAVWPTKYDSLEVDIRVAPHIFGYPGFWQGGIGLTQTAELYLKFGVAGILIGMFLIGALHSALVRWLLDSVSPLHAFVYSLIWPWVMISVEGWSYAVYPNILRVGAPALLVAWTIAWLSSRRALKGSVA